MDEWNWVLGELFDSNRTVNQETSDAIERLKSHCFEARLLVTQMVLSIVGLAQTCVVSTATIKRHVVEKSTLDHKVVATNKALRQFVVCY